MKTREIIALTSVMMAALAFGNASAAAEVPTAGQPETSMTTQLAPGIHYTASVVDRSVVLRTDSGRLNVRGNEFEVLDDNGRLVAGFPLTYQLDQKDWPIAARVDGHTAVLTPSRDPARAVASTTTELRPVYSQSDFNDAVGVAANQIGLATGMGALIGTAAGLVGGCVAGAVVGTALMPPIFFAGAPGGCLAGAAAGAALGAAAGTILVGGPVAVASVIQLFDTLNQSDN